MEGRIQNVKDKILGVLSFIKLKEIIDLIILSKL